MNDQRHRRLKRLAARIQNQIVSCENEQSRDEGETIWVNGCETDVEELLDQNRVPENLKDDVLSLLSCPRCGSAIELGQDVGTKHHVELDLESKQEEARKLEPLIVDFIEFLREHPLLGASHLIGKRIQREIKDFPKVTLVRKNWFRGRKVQGAIPMKTGDLCPPEATEYEVPGGRFNNCEQAHWYLASTAEAAVAEVTSDQERCGWAQEWSVDPVDHILDVRAWDPESDRALDDNGEPHQFPLLAIALIFGDWMNQRPNPGSKFRPEYFLPRFIADAAKRAGFNGICYSSSRHFDENLVLFDAKLKLDPVGIPRLVFLDEDEAKRRDTIIFSQGFPDSFP